MKVSGKKKKSKSVNVFGLIAWLPYKHFVWRKQVNQVYKSKMLDVHENCWFCGII